LFGSSRLLDSHLTSHKPYLTILEAAGAANENQSHSHELKWQHHGGPRTFCSATPHLQGFALEIGDSRMLASQWPFVG
jgi:hypothetical protein